MGRKENRNLDKAAKIEELDERSHALLRPGMYIGDSSTNSKIDWVPLLDKGCWVVARYNYNEAYFKLFQEILDNSVDEFLKTEGKFGNKISVELKDVGHFIVKDNGRGIDSTKDAAGATGVEKAFTRLRAGSNFSQREDQAGMNGVGCTLVNIFSKSFRVETCDGKNSTILECSDNMLNKTVKIKAAKTRGTEVEAIIDAARFPGIEGISMNVMKSLVHKRLTELVTAYPDLKLTLDGEKINKPILDYLKDNYVGKIYSDRNVKFGIFFSGENVGKDISYVNGIATTDGGKHQDYFVDFCIEDIKKRIDKKNKIDVKQSQIKDRLFFVLILTKFKNATFSNQNKTKLINGVDEIRNVLPESKIDSFLKTFLKDYGNEFNDLVEELNSEHDARLLKDHSKKLKKVQINNFIDAISNNRGKCSLFIAEGLSAKSTFIEVRDQSLHAILPIKGKILNVYNKSLKKVLDNKEICDLMKAIGLEVGKKATNLNFGSINMLTDADPDGDSITCLLMVFFYKFWPELFGAGIVRKILSPIVIAHKGKDVKRFYSLEEYKAESGKLQGYEVEYIKGLGSLELGEYSRMINQQNCLTISVTDVELANKKLELLFSDDTDDRKEWLSDENGSEDN